MLTESSHPVLACAATIDAALKDIDGVEPAFMRTGDKAEALVEFARLETQLAAWRMRIMATADDVAEETGARDVAAWLGVRPAPSRPPVGLSSISRPPSTPGGHG